MTTPHGRRIQGRRALAILTWLTLAVVAGLLWFAQERRLIRVQAWEPAALLLSAYAAFLAIFGWMLFSPERAAAEESPGIFFGGMLTLLPPCFIAYHLMPVDSPLKGWATFAVFVFGLIAILSPLPADVFAIPRDRRSYLRPLTDSYLATLDIDEPQLQFDTLLPRTQFRLTQPSATTTSAQVADARDPWVDPFSGTGRQLSRIGVSRSRRSEGDERRVGADAPDEQTVSTVDRPDQPTLRPSEPLTRRPVSVFPAVTPRMTDVSLTPPPLPPMVPPARDLSATTTGTAWSSPSIIPSPAAPLSPPTRRPLTEPGVKPVTSVGFQTPTAVRPFVMETIGSAPPLPVLHPPLPPASPSITAAATFPAALETLAQMASPLAAPPVRSAEQIHSASTTPRNVFELDRELRHVQDFDDHDADDDRDESELAELGAAPGPAPGIVRSGKQSAGDATYERIRDEQGGEMIEGTIPVVFEIGQKRAHLHVPFSPPLGGVPEIECEPVSDDSIRLKVAVRQPYGLRIEARRAEASDELRTEISFSAIYTPTTRR